MIDVSATHPFVACAAFAVEWLAQIAAYDLARAEAMIDLNESGIPFAQSFPAPKGFTYCHPNQVESWEIFFCAVTHSGLCLDFEVPFAERGFRPMKATFTMKRLGNSLEVSFGGLDIP